jgi:hypothetical protein
VAPETKGEAIVRALAMARRAGSKADMVVLNDVDWGDIADEFGVSANLFQFTNSTPDNKNKNIVQAGLGEMGFMFSTSWIKNVYDDPYCPRLRGYILDSSCIEFVGLSNPNALDDGIDGNNPGVQYPDDLSMPNADDYKFMIDDYLTVEPGAADASGPAKRVSLSLYGNFVVRAPGKCVAITFV